MKRGVVGTGSALKTARSQRTGRKFGDDVCVFDGRNQYEAKVGRFKMPSYQTHGRLVISNVSLRAANTTTQTKVISYCLVVSAANS